MQQANTENYYVGERSTLNRSGYTFFYSKSLKKSEGKETERISVGYVPVECPKTTSLAVIMKDIEFYSNFQI